MHSWSQSNSKDSPSTWAYRLVLGEVVPPDLFLAHSSIGCISMDTARPCASFLTPPEKIPLKVLRKAMLRIDFRQKISTSPSSMAASLKCGWFLPTSQGLVPSA